MNTVPRSSHCLDIAMRMLVSKVHFRNLIGDRVYSVLRFLLQKIRVFGVHLYIFLNCGLNYAPCKGWERQD